MQRVYELDVMKTSTLNHKRETNLHILLEILPKEKKDSTNSYVNTIICTYERRNENLPLR